MVLVAVMWLMPFYYDSFLNQLHMTNPTGAFMTAFHLASFGNNLNFVLVLNEKFIKHCKNEPEVSISSLHFYVS